MRESTNYPGDYTLCVSCEGKVEHYRIIYSSSKLSIDEEVYFENLMQLVEVSRGGARVGGAVGPCPKSHGTLWGVLGLAKGGDGGRRRDGDTPQSPSGTPGVRQDWPWGEMGAGGGMGTPHPKPKWDPKGVALGLIPPPSPRWSHSRPRAATWWDLRARHGPVSAPPAR